MHADRNHGVSFHDVQDVKRRCVLIKNGLVSETIHLCRIGLARGDRGKYLLGDPGRGGDQIDHKRLIPIQGVIALAFSSATDSSAIPRSPIMMKAFPFTT